MILTRYVINKNKNKVKKYLNKLSNKSKIYLISKKYIRSNKFSINYSKNLNNKILFIYDPIECHWAETDGINIWLNTYKNYNNKLLFYTILHECLHGIILRNNKYYLSEQLEHKIMEDIDKNLI